MASPSERLYSGAAADIDFDLVRHFVLDAEDTKMFTESLTFEAKERGNGNNIVEAVAALSNSDGGIVLVGVRDKNAVGTDRIVGVPQADHDRLVSQLHSLIPTAMPEVLSVRIPGADRLVLVVRVDADAVAHPVLVAGKCSIGFQAIVCQPTGNGYLISLLGMPLAAPRVILLAA